MRWNCKRLWLCSFTCDSDSAAQYFEESISVYTSALGKRDTLTLSVQDDYSHFLILTGQQEVGCKITWIWCMQIYILIINECLQYKIEGPKFPTTGGYWLCWEHAFMYKINVCFGLSEMCSDPKRVISSEKKHLWWNERRGGRSAAADWWSGDDTGPDETRPQDPQKGENDKKKWCTSFLQKDHTEELVQFSLWLASKDIWTAIQTKVS